jgi:hypothetical protein
MMLEAQLVNNRSDEELLQKAALRIEHRFRIIGDAQMYSISMLLNSDG